MLKEIHKILKDPECRDNLIAFDVSMVLVVGTLAALCFGFAWLGNVDRARTEFAEMGVKFSALLYEYEDLKIKISSVDEGLSNLSKHVDIAQMLIDDHIFSVEEVIKELNDHKSKIHYGRLNP